MVDLGVQRFQNQSFRGKNEPSYLWMPRRIALAGLMTGLILGYVWSQDAITGSSYRIEELRQANAQLSDAIGAFRAEQSSLLNPEKIDRLAAELGLVRSNQVGVRIVEGVPQSESTENLLAESIPVRKVVNE
tara:strand:+ start:65 stop:460 length:396 start_codon:yes stop_codon:yes gene_type:complete